MSIQKFRLILASQSPRRVELLGHLGYQYEVCPSSFEEGLLSKDDPCWYVEKNALGKASDVAKRNLQTKELTPCLIVGSDTIVELNGNVLEKPKNREDAKNMLAQLSKQRQRVYTGVAILEKKGDNVRSIAKFHVTTFVEFKSLREDEIERYIDSGEPMDKAGAYGIQGGGSAFVKAIEGSYSNVMGLPLCEIEEIIYNYHINLLKDE